MLDRHMFFESLNSEWTGYWLAGVIVLLLAIYVCLYLFATRVHLWWLRRAHQRLQEQIAWRCHQLIEELRTGLAESVTIYQTNDDFGGPAEMVCINGEWTGFEDRNFSGDTLLEALTHAAVAKRQAGFDIKHELPQ